MAPQESDLPQPPVELELWPEARVAVVKLRGEHDIATEKRIADALAAATEKASRVLVDLQECSFVDTSLIRAVAGARARLGSSVVLGVVIPPSATAARRLANVARLEDIVPVYDSREAAIGPPERA